MFHHAGVDGDDVHPAADEDLPQVCVFDALGIERPDHDDGLAHVRIMLQKPADRVNFRPRPR
jgi:hypothetical protein